jgi:hypothetical protein
MMSLHTKVFPQHHHGMDKLQVIYLARGLCSENDLSGVLISREEVKHVW